MSAVHLGRRWRGATTAVLQTTAQAVRRLHVQDAYSGGAGTHGFKRWEYGLEWYQTKQALLEASPGPVLVGSSYQYWSSQQNGKLQDARKYSGLESHWDYWDQIESFEKKEEPQNFHEVLLEGQPRCLYFDIDGQYDYNSMHAEIVNFLKMYVRWCFQGDRMGWDKASPEAVVMKTEDPSKYSCHVIFPQIQFRDHSMQRDYMTICLAGLSALKVHMDGGKKVPILEQVVDTVPYMPFQLWRGPYACKLKNGALRLETQLVPEGLFRADELSCFAGHVDPDNALPLPSPEELLSFNEELRDIHQTRLSGVTAMFRSCGPYQHSEQDSLNLYNPRFQQRETRGYLDLAGLSSVDIYEECFSWLHPDRCNVFWSWFRICGVTFSMLEKYGDDPEKRFRIWEAHHKWSSGYPRFSEEENVAMVLKSKDKRVSGLSLLRRLVVYDNPELSVRAWSHEPFSVYRKTG